MPGRTWDNGKCLFIRDYVLQVETREAALIGDPNGRFRVEKPEKIIMGHRGDKAIEPDLAYRPVLDTSSVPVHPAVDPHTHDFVWDVMAASSTAIIKHFGAHPGDGYVKAVLQALVDGHELSATNSKTGNICTTEVGGPRTKICPRIALWAHGTVAPCTIRPF